MSDAKTIKWSLHDDLQMSMVIFETFIQIAILGWTGQCMIKWQLYNKKTKTKIILERFPCNKLMWILPQSSDFPVQQFLNIFHFKEHVSSLHAEASQEVKKIYFQVEHYQNTCCNYRALARWWRLDAMITTDLQGGVPHLRLLPRGRSQSRHRRFSGAPQFGTQVFLNSYLIKINV